MFSLIDLASLSLSLAAVFFSNISYTNLLPRCSTALSALVLCSYMYNRVMYALCAPGAVSTLRFCVQVSYSIYITIKITIIVMYKMSLTHSCL